MKKLTQKQETFIVNVHKGMTQYDAYLDAYPKSAKWKRKGVDDNAYKLMQTTEIIQRHDELKAMVVERMLDTVEVNMKNVLQELSLLAFSDPAKLFDENGHLIPICELPEEVSRTISEINTSVKMVGRGEDAEPYEITKIKQHDKKGSLDMLVKHLGGYEKDNVLEVNGAVQYIIKKSAKRERPISLNKELPHEPTAK